MAIPTSRIAMMVSWAGVGVLAVLEAGCAAELACGEGTVERNGVCEAASVLKEPAWCGSGTYFDPASQSCVASAPPGTLPGSDSAATCAAPIACPSPTPGTLTLCGRLLDVETGAPLVTGGTSTGECASADAGGPCSLALAFHDATDGYSDVAAAAPLALAALTVDGCGRFRAVDVEVPAASRSLVGVAASAEGVGAEHVPTAAVIALPALREPGEPLEGISLYATRASTDAAWTASAGSPFGAVTIAQVGAYLALFRHGSQPVEGVTLTAGGAVRPELDYYFADTDSALCGQLDGARDATGRNGAGLLVDTAATDAIPIRGAGGEAAGCAWPDVTGAVVPGLILVHEHLLASSSTPGAPCE